VATVFEEETLNTIVDLYRRSKPYAAVLGIDPFLAIGGPAEELHTINSYDPFRYYGDQFLDAWSNVWWQSHPCEIRRPDRWSSDKAKIFYPVLADMGIANVKLNTALDLLDEYNGRYPNTDPLDLKKYNDSFDDLVSDLTSRSDLEATAKFSVLEAAEAIEFFEKRAPAT
jgi:hypothetical protein